MATLDDFTGLVERDSLCVVTSTRSDARVQASLVNAGVLAHPVGGLRPVMADERRAVVLVTPRRTYGVTR